MKYIYQILYDLQRACQDTEAAYNILISNYFTIEERGELRRICLVIPKKSEKPIILTNFVFLKNYGNV